MRRPLLAIVLLTLLAACGRGQRALPMPDGQVFRLNPDQWGEPENSLRSATR